MSSTLKITAIGSVVFGYDLTTIYAPATSQQASQYYNLYLEALFGPIPVITKVEGELVNSKTGATHKISTITFRREVEGPTYVTIGLTSETAEDDNIDYISLKIYTNTNETYVRKKISVKKVREAFSTFKYKVGNVKLIDSNLLSPRVKLGFAKWSTVHKNDISNATKLLEPLHSTFSSAFTKTNEMLKQTYDLEYTPYTFSRIFLNGYPLNIFRYAGLGKEELKETDDIYSSIKKVELINNPEDYELKRVFFYPNTENNKDKLFSLKNILPSTLYIKKINTNEKLFCRCVIKGFDIYENPITEIVTLRTDLYTQLQNKFARLVSIQYDSNTIELANYIDLRFNHYIISRPYITPPIVDSNFLTFKPHPVIKSNQEITHNTLVLNNGLSANGTEQYRFAFKNPTKITSLFVTEELDVLYTESSTLNYSKLRIDYTKEIFNDKTLNNNKFIEVSDTKTSIGDWVDVTVNISDWFAYKGQKSLVIRVRNGNQVLYYSQEKSKLVDVKTHYYSGLDSVDVLEFAVNVENSNPYIFSILSSDDSETVSAMTNIDTIDPYYTETIDSSYLVHYNGDVITVNESPYDTALDTSNELSYEDKVSVVLQWSGYSTLNYKISFGSYYISSDDSNLNPDFYEVILPENSNNDIVVVLLDSDMLLNLLKSESLSFQLGASFDSGNGLVDGTETCKATIVAANNLGSISTEITPEVQYEPTYIMQKDITISPDGVIEVSEILNEDE